MTEKQKYLQSIKPVERTIHVSSEPAYATVVNELTGLPETKLVGRKNQNTYKYSTHGHIGTGRDKRELKKFRATRKLNKLLKIN